MSVSPAKFRDRALLGVDQLRWRWQTRHLRNGFAPAATGTALFCDLMSMIATAKVETLFAGILRCRGYRTVVLLPERWRVLEITFRAAGPVEFVFLDDYISDATKAEAVRKADEIIARPWNFRTFLDLEVDGFRVGRNVLSLVMRHFRIGTLDPTDEAQIAMLRQVLARSLATVEAAPLLLAHVQPDIAFFCERGYTSAGEIFDACVQSGVNTIQWLGAPQSDQLLFKRYTPENRHFHPQALSDRTWSSLREMPWGEDEQQEVMDRLRSHYDSGTWFNRQRLQENKVIKDADQVREQLGLDPDRKTAVIFSHILYDATFFYGTSLFDDYETWLVETVRAAIENPRLNWIVKVHPVNVWRSKMDGAVMEQLELAALTRVFGMLPEHVTVLAADTDINTFALFDVIDYGLTVRGTVGMELPCFGIPVVTAGSGRYSGRGFTIDPQTVDAYRDTLLTLHEVPPLDTESIELARRYAFGTFFVRPWKVRSFKLDFFAETFGLDALRQNVSIRRESAARLQEAEDMQRLMRWVLDSDDHDLLNMDLQQLQAGGHATERRAAGGAL